MSIKSFIGIPDTSIKTVMSAPVADVKSIQGSNMNPPLPENLAVTEVLGGYDLSWTAIVDTQIEIYKAIDAYNYTLLTTTTAGASSYSDVTATYGITKYNIRAKRSGQYSSYTNAVTKTSPYNQIKGEGGLTPNFLPWPFVQATANITDTLEDNTDGLFQTAFPKKRRVTCTGTGAAYTSQTNIYLPPINPSIISFGFWINDTDVALVYGTSGATSLMNLWLYMGGVTHNLNFTIRTVNAVVGNNETGTFAQAGKVSGSYKVICLAKSSGYSFIAITWHTMTWTLANSDGNLFSLYMLYSNIVLNGNKIDYIGFTWHYNDEIISANPAPDTSVSSGNLFVNRKLHGTNNDVWMRFPYNATKDLLIQGRPFETVVDNNNASLLNTTYLIPVATYEGFVVYINAINIHQTADDDCPIKLASTYIGGQHGTSDMVVVTKNGHDKNVMDVGSEWLDSASHKFYIIRIYDANTIWFLSENIGTGNIWSFRTMANGTITHSSGATNTGSIATPTILNSQQLLPSIKNHSVQMLVNGNIDVNADMKVKGSYIDIIQTYDIVNPASVLTNVRASLGSGVQPLLNVGNSAFTVNKTLRILADGTNIINTTFTFNQEAALDYIGFVQSSKMYASGTLAKVKMFIPKSLAIGGYDFNLVADFTSNPGGVLDFTSEYWADANSPVDRVTQFLSLANDTRQHAFAMGYIPNYGVMASRKDVVTNAWSFFTTSKSYPHGADSKITPIANGTIMLSHAFRKYFDVTAMPTRRVSNYFIEDGTDTYLYIEYNGVISDTITIPASYQGKTITLIEKSANVSYTDSVTGATLAVEVTTATPLTGYLVLKLT
jgi:hypothetical protein